jgi:cytochrome P450
MKTELRDTILNPNFLLEPSFHQTDKKYELWQFMRNNYPIYLHQHADFPVCYSITRYKDVKKVYKDPILFSSAKGVLLRTNKQGEDPGANLTLALTDPPKHRKLRDIVSKWFSASYIKMIEFQVRQQVQQLFSSALNKGGCDITQDVTSPLTLSVTCSILGIPESQHKAVLKCCHDSFTNGTGLINNRDFMIFISEFIQYKQLNPGNDLSSAIILALIDDKKLTEKEILLNFENLIGATENASLSLSSGILAMIQYEKNIILLKKDRTLMPLAIDEILRWASSASHSMRTVTEDTMFYDIKFFAGNKIILWLPSANRDQSIFDQPDSFDITRSPNPHVALGHGEHFCIGNLLGKMQARLILSEILDSNLIFKLSSSPQFLSSIHVNGPEYLPVTITR